MTNTIPERDGVEVALLTIQLDADTVSEVNSAVSRMLWNVIPLDYQSYFSPTRLPPLTQRAIQAQACLAIIDFDLDPELALQTAECLRQSFFQKIGILAYSATTDPNLLMHAMRAGYSEFIAKPLEPEDFAEVLARLNHRWSAAIATPSGGGKILSFFGAKGGVGTTTLVVHLAMFLVKAFGKKVLLIDNHAQLGHVVLYLGMDASNHHFYDLVRNVSRLDQELLRGFLATHPSGLDVLSSPDVYGGVWKADTESVERTLEFLSTQYDYVVLDCEASFEDINLAIIALSNWIYLIATPEIGAIRDLSRYVDGLIQNEQATRKLQVVINRYSSHEAVTIEQIEKAVHLPITYKIPNSYSLLVQSVNVGDPVAHDNKSEFAALVMKWAAALTGGLNPATAEPLRKRFALWK